MKKLLVVMAIVMLVLINNKTDEIIIPDNAIRYRVVANSNSAKDQLTKVKISTHMQDYLINLTKEAKSSEDATDILLANSDNINREISTFIAQEHLNTSYEVKIGQNYFPKKSYKGVDYSEGYYNSIVINIGHKQGVNWWCVMYPPLCLLDQQENLKEVEYTTYAQELLNNYKR